MPTTAPPSRCSPGHHDMVGDAVGTHHLADEFERAANVAATGQH
jgi:hypothetical protein